MESKHRSKYIGTEKGKNWNVSHKKKPSQNTIMYCGYILVHQNYYKEFLVKRQRFWCSAFAVPNIIKPATNFLGKKEVGLLAQSFHLLLPLHFPLEMLKTWRRVWRQRNEFSQLCQLSLKRALWFETFFLFSDTMRWPGHAGIEKEIDWKDDFYIQVSYFSSLRSLHTFRECIRK